MDNLEAKLFAASLRTDLPTIDLHGLHADEATHRLDIFLFEVNMEGEAALKAITGIGSGALQEAVEKYLQKHPLVATMMSSSGSTIVILK